MFRPWRGSSGSSSRPTCGSAQDPGVLALPGTRRWRPALRAAPLVLACLTATPAFAGHGGAGSVLTEYPEPVKRLMETRKPVVLVDVRAAEAYRKAHVPGARSVPFVELGGRAHEIPQSGLVVLYGETRFEGRRAYEVLRGLGYRNLIVLEDGFAGWTGRGFPVARGP